MKKLIITLFCLLPILGSAQNAKRKTDGNFIAISKAKTTESKAVKTSNTYTDTKGVIYPVYRTENGKLFVKKVSKKSGKEYKMYLKF